MSQNNYFPQIFTPQSLEHAKEIILSSDPTGEKWTQETDLTGSLMLKSLEKFGASLSKDQFFLDYGCGIGRMSKFMIDQSAVNVIGADISPGMLWHAIPYVSSDRFLPCPRNLLEALSEKKFQVDVACSIWTLQHCLNPDEDINLILKLLKPGGILFVANKYDRYLPVTPVDQFARWHNDQIDVLEILEKKFETLDSLPALGAIHDDYFKVLRKRD